jgi:hypothetical protein
VPSFHQMFPNEKCDLLFIDGGHMYENAIKDLMNFKPMIRGPNHILLMDDISREVARAWNDMVNNGFVVEEARVSSDWADGYLIPFDENMVFNGGRIVNHPDQIHPEYAGVMGYGKYVH